MTFSLISYTDQKPLDLAQGAEMKHVLVGNKVCTNGLYLYNVDKNLNSWNGEIHF